MLQIHVATHLRMPGGVDWWAYGQTLFIPEVRERLNEALSTAPRLDEVDPAWQQAQRRNATEDLRPA